MKISLVSVEAQNTLKNTCFWATLAYSTVILMVIPIICGFFPVMGISEKALAFMSVVVISAVATADRKVFELNSLTTIILVMSWWSIYKIN
ncbi:hypothetical protein [Vibrio crassostreae]|uniref:hypothetical protein n=1 Tax=Vibrio crassostreae TaxID=246167 RepID=UPI001B3157EE|nr:hypothetical protein [Vibrio crassostreae]